MKKNQYYLSRVIAAMLIFSLTLGTIGSPVQSVLAAPLDAPQADPPTGTLQQSALVLVNSASSSYADFQHFIQAYLDHFGVPYTILDIATTEVGLDINEYAVLIVGHRGLDAGVPAYLNSTEQTNIANAVNDGTGLVNFDNDLSPDGSTARYQFVDDVFTFGYNNDTSGSNVTFAIPPSHYITERHNDGQVVTTGTMALAGISLPGDVTSLATTGTQSFLAVTTYGSGRAVQFGSYAWISHAVKGPLFGLDDLFWRSIVWAARKPFVMQGLPPFVTMRMDDVSGPLWWMDIANEYGFIPWAGAITANIDAAEAAELSGLVNSGKATTSMHAFERDNRRFFYYDHINSSNYDDTTMADHYTEATQWFADNNIPIAKYVTPHFYEIGSNAFTGLGDWGVEFINTVMDPGQNEASAPWMMAGPFRLFETGSAYNRAQNVYYADYIPGYPDFFNCITEIRDVTGYEWLGNGRTGVPAATADGIEWVTRALDSMAIADLFSHEYELIGSLMSQANWESILQGITTGIADYNPLYVSRDYACQYARAVVDSDISSVSFDTATGQLSTDFTGTTDMDTKFYVFTESGDQITQYMINVPTFVGSTQVNFSLPGALDHITVAPDPATPVAGTTQQFTAAGFDVDNNPIPNLAYTWSVVNGGGTINNGGLFTVGNTPGTYTDTVRASLDSINGEATVEVIGTTLDHFEFEAITNPRYAGQPFSVSIRARDASNNPVVTYNGTATLSASAGTIQPVSVNFVDGVWSGEVTIPDENANVTITAQDGSNTGTSNEYDILQLTCPCSIWDNTPGVGAVANDPNSYELGVKFRSAQDGYITALRFYKYPANTGTHVGRLWNMSGTLLGSATFTGETASGWQEVTLDPPVAVTADTVYAASYSTDSGYYAFSANYFTSQGVTNGPLHALSAAESPVPGTNGFYNDTPGLFPNTSFNDINYWVDVVFDTTPPGGDTTPPTITDRSPVNGATGVARGTNVSVTFSEPMNAASITDTTFTLRADGAGSDVPATVNYYNNWVATLDPDADLQGSTTYQVTVSGTVEDLAGNPLGSNATWSFTTTNQESLIDTSVADFNAGTVGACYVDAGIGDGALRLGPALNEDFSGTALPAGWAQAPWGAGGSATVAGGSLSVNGAIAGTTSAYTPGRVLEFNATFTGEMFQHVGFTDSLAFNGPWAIFSTYTAGTDLYARTSGTDTLIPGSYLNAPHLYRIEWTASTIEYYIDDNLVATHNTPISTPMIVVASDANLNATAVSVDWLRMDPPYVASCEFESRVLDAGEPVDWTTLSSTATLPAGTSVSFDARTGNTTSPDISWTNWQAANGALTNPGSQYIQYRATLASTDAGQTPVLEDVTINYAPGAISVLNTPDGMLTSWDGAFDWSGVNGATWYLLEVYTPTMTQVHRKWYTSAETNCSAGTACSFTPTDLSLGNGDYQWRVMDYGAYGYGIWPQFKDFTLNAACYTLATNLNPAGSGTVNAPAQSCAGGYLDGTVVQLTAAPGTGYAFSSWSGSASGTSNPVSVTMDGNKSVTANMRGNTPLAPSGTLSSWDGTFSWTGLSDATWYLIEAQTSGGTQVFRKWYTSPQTGCSGGTACSVTPVGLSLANGDYKWRVMDYGAYGYGLNSAFKNFTLNAACYTLATSVNPGGSGVVNTPTQSCAGGYTAGTIVQLTAVPGTGYAFSSWSGAAGGTSNPVSVTMDGNKSVTANMRGNTPIAPSGALTDWDHAFSWTGLSNATWYLIEAQTSGGTQVFRQWYTSTQTGCSGGTACSVTPGGLSLANGDYKWRVMDYGAYGYGLNSAFKNFSLNAACYTLTTNVNPGGSGTVNAPAQTCAGGYTAGSVIQLSAVPNTGYLFDNWSGAASGTSNPVSVTMDGNKSVTANFKSTVVLLAPSGTLTSWNNTFSWTGLTNATWYLLEVYTPGGTQVHRKWYTSPQTGCSGGTSCSVVPPETAGLGNGDYKWRMLDYGAYGYGTWTSYKEFSLNQ